MKQALRIAGFAILGIFAILAVVAFDFLRHGGAFASLEPQGPDSCATVPMEASAEDIQIDRERGVAYLSYLDRRAQVEGQPVLGTVMLLDLNRPEPRPRAALLDNPPAFRPHGMSLYVTPEGRRWLFVISHPPDAGHTVEIFRETPAGIFAHEETIRDALLFDPNAIVAVGARQFYVANDSGARNGFERVQEMLFRRGLADLVYFDGSSMRVVGSGLKTPAGIATSPDLVTVYVGETSGKRMRIYERDVVDGDLELLETVELPGAPDNLNVDAEGKVWIAAHAKILALIRHFGDPAKPAPTMILRFEPGVAEAERVRTILVDPGEKISAGSVGAVWRDTLLVGSITDRKVLLCELK
jgi:arylesterase/paraoxonase